MRRLVSDFAQFRNVFELLFDGRYKEHAATLPLSGGQKALALAEDRKFGFKAETAFVSIVQVQIAQDGVEVFKKDKCICS